MSQGTYQLPEKFENLNDVTVYVFFESVQNQLFYRAEALLVGFDKIIDREQVFQPQNIVASYLTDTLQCDGYVKLNLVDQRLNEVDSESIFTNFNQGYFNIVYKDKAMLFLNGNLVGNSAFSNGKKLAGNPDLFVVEKAIYQITRKRVMVSTPSKQ